MYLILCLSACEYVRIWVSAGHGGVLQLSLMEAAAWCRFMTNGVHHKWELQIHAYVTLLADIANSILFNTGRCCCTWNHMASNPLVWDTTRYICLDHPLVWDTTWSICLIHHEDANLFLQFNRYIGNDSRQEKGEKTQHFYSSALELKKCYVRSYLYYLICLLRQER